MPLASSVLPFDGAFGCPSPGRARSLMTMPGLARGVRFAPASTAEPNCWSSSPVLNTPNATSFSTHKVDLLRRGQFWRWILTEVGVAVGQPESTDSVLCFERVPAWSVGWVLAGDIGEWRGWLLCSSSA